MPHVEIPQAEFKVGFICLCCNRSIQGLWTHVQKHLLYIVRNCYHSAVMLFFSQVVILGDTHIGKTSLVTRFAEGYYREHSRPATVGAFFVTKRIQTSDGTTCKIQIWDTAGQKSFRAMAHMFYRNASAAIVCYDVGSKPSFEVMREWLDEIRRRTSGEEEISVVFYLYCR